MEYQESYFKREGTLDHAFPGTANAIASGIFDYCHNCKELLIVTSSDINNRGKVAIFMAGDNINDSSIEDLERMSKWFIPLGVWPVFFIVESVDNIDYKKLLENKG